jgi:hypothetical protein
MQKLADEVRAGKPSPVAKPKRGGKRSGRKARPRLDPGTIAVVNMPRRFWSALYRLARAQGATVNTDLQGNLYFDMRVGFQKADGDEGLRQLVEEHGKAPVKPVPPPPAERIEPPMPKEPLIVRLNRARVMDGQQYIAAGSLTDDEMELQLAEINSRLRIEPVTSAREGEERIGVANSDRPFDDEGHV